MPFVVYLGDSMRGDRLFQKLKALGSIAAECVALPKKGDANVTIGVCKDWANAWLNRVGLVGMPVIGGGFGLNFVSADPFDDDLPPPLTGEQPCDEVELSADAGDEAVDRLEGDGDRDDGRGAVICRRDDPFDRLMWWWPTLTLVESLSAPSDPHSESM